MKKDASIHMLEDGIRRIFVFDGDQSNSVQEFDLSTVPIDVTPEALDGMILEWLGVSIGFRQDSNMSDDQKISIRKDFIEYANKTFRILPFETPEAAIWSDERARDQLRVVGADEGLIDKITTLNDCKEKFLALSEATQPLGQSLASSNISTIHGIFVTGFCNDANSLFVDMNNLLKEIADNA